MISTYINSIGLVVDIVGTLILFKYGLPSDVMPNGIIVKSMAGVDEKDKFDKYKKRSKWGLGFLIGGFALQLTSNFVNS
jgi:hypothetical protein